MLIRATSNVWLSLLLVFLQIAAYHLWPGDAQASGMLLDERITSSYLYLFLRTLFFVLITMLWTDAFRARLGASDQFVVAVVTATVLLLLDSSEPLWLEQNGIQLLLLCIVYRRFLSSTEAVRPDHAMFDLGWLSALLILMNPAWLALIVWIVMAGLFMGRVKIRQHLVPLVGTLSLWWVLWALNDLSLGMGWRKWLDASLDAVFRWGDEATHPKTGSWPEYPLLAAVFLLSFVGYRRLWLRGRAMERQVLNVLIWAVFLFGLFRWLPFMGGAHWWMAILLPFTLFASRFMEALSRLWVREMLLWAWLVIPVIFRTFFAY